jgi:hypothetical protein
MHITNFHLSLLFFLLALSLNAQNESDFLTDYSGHYSYKYESNKTLGEVQQYTSMEDNIIITKLSSINKYLEGNALISNPKGTEILLTSQISDKSPFSGWANNSLISEIYFAVYPWYNQNGKAEYKCYSCHAYFTIHINNPLKAFNGLSIDGKTEITDGEGSLMMIEPELLGEQDGCKLYKNQIIVITNQKPLWVDVTVKSYDEALIRYYEIKVKENPSEAFASNFLIEKIKEEMSAFSSEELNSPAYYGGRIGGCPSTIEHTNAIVKLNSKYFDKDKPKTAIQLMILEIPYIFSEKSDDGYYNKDEYSSFQERKLIEILNGFKYSEWRKFFN